MFQKAILMAMVQSSRLMQQETLWARVNGLREGGSTMETQMCSSLKPVDVLLWKIFLARKKNSRSENFSRAESVYFSGVKWSDLKLAISLFFAAFKVFLVILSPCSVLSQQSQKKWNTCCVWRSWMVTLLIYLIIRVFVKYNLHYTFTTIIAHKCYII